MLGVLGGIGFFVFVFLNFMMVVFVLICGVFLWFGNYKWIVNLLGIVVVLMGVVFILVVF